MEKTQEIAVSQLRNAVEKLGTPTEKYGDPTLMRFLIARSMDTDKAAKMFVEWHKWRTAFVPLGCIPDSEVQDELGAKKIYLQRLSKEGFAVVVAKINKHFPSKDRPQFKKFVVQVLDKAIASFQYLLSELVLDHFSTFKGREIGNEKLVFVVDLKNITYKNIDVRGMITGFQFLQAYYPERLAKLYFLHMPGFFVTAWRMVSYFIEKETLKKIIIVTNEEEKRDFIRVVGEEALPKEYGGGAKLVALQDVVLAHQSH